VAPLFVSECTGENDPQRATDVVILDWTGGSTRIFPDLDFPGLDFNAFETPDGGTLAADEDGFRELVRVRVARLLCDFTDAAVLVENGEGPSERPISTIYVVDADSPRRQGQVGEGEYDPCNEEHDNDAVLFAKELLVFGGTYTTEEWALMFANVIAHEIGHMLGYNHAPRTDTRDAEHALYVELMLASHTVDEMLREQRFLADMTNCDADPTTSRHASDNPLTCGILEAE